MYSRVFYFLQVLQAYHVQISECLLSLPCPPLSVLDPPQATSMALSAFPTLTASLSEDRKTLLQHPSHNIGVAMDTSKGLLVPCISSVEEMSVLDIAEVGEPLVLWCCRWSGVSVVILGRVHSM